MLLSWGGQIVATIMWMVERVGLIKREESIMRFVEPVAEMIMVLQVLLEVGRQQIIAPIAIWLRSNLS